MRVRGDGSGRARQRLSERFCSGSIGRFSVDKRRVERVSLARECACGAASWRFSKFPSHSVSFTAVSMKLKHARALLSVLPAAVTCISRINT